MSQAIIFNGDELAQKRSTELLPIVDELSEQGIGLKIAAVLFEEDMGSLLYTQLKSQQAQKLGIGYERHIFSLQKDSIEQIKDKIEELNKDSKTTGIIIQKPWKKTWSEYQDDPQDFTFNSWWEQLVNQIKLTKDVDGLHPQTQASIRTDEWQDKGSVLPATAKAVLTILDFAQQRLQKKSESNFRLAEKRIVIVGRSTLVGKPVYWVLKNLGYDVEMIGREGLSNRIEQNKFLLDADVVISATGRRKLITGRMVKKGSVLIDVGEPRPDLEFETVKNKAAFVTPVPGGVGPMTVISLMENCVLLGQSRLK